MSGRITTESLQIVFPRIDAADGANTDADPGMPGRQEKLLSNRSEAGKEADAAAAPRMPELELSLAAWRSDDFPFWSFDREVDALAAASGGARFAVRLLGQGQHMPEAARQVLVRCQRLAGRRNAASRCDLFERVLAGHRSLFDADQALSSSAVHAPSAAAAPAPSAVAAAAAAAGHARALDRWQWLLHLEPDAGLEPQIAALFHDVERLSAAGQATATADAGGARQLRAGRSQAGQGAWIADELLVDLGVDLATRVRVHELIRGHSSSHQPVNLDGTAARELTLLRNADALSFFSLDSAATLASAGPEQTRRKVAAALARMSADCRERLGALRLCQPLRQMIACEMAHLKEAARRRGVPAGRAATGAGFGAGSRTAGEGAPLLNPLADRVIGPSGVLGAIDSLGRHDGRPSPALVMARSRLAVGMLGAAALAPTRLAPLLARAQALGALGAGVSPISPSVVRSPSAVESVA